MSLPRLDTNYLVPDVTRDHVAAMQPYVDLAHRLLVEKTGPGSEMLGWVNPAALMPPDLRTRIKNAASRLRGKSDVMVVVGIGGSYLGARAVIDALPSAESSRVLYAGQTLCASYMADLMRQLKGKRWCINVVSKSGTTTEPAVAFRILKKQLEDEVGREAARELIVATTDPDPAKSALRRVADKEGYETFSVPPDVGGRFSVLSAVGVLPIAFAGADVDALVQGAADCCSACANPNVLKNPAYHYAAVRNLLYRQGKSIELTAVVEPQLYYLVEWWKQLFGESEGKDHSSLFPAGVQYTTDLHSMGQWVQEGRRNLFETFLCSYSLALKVEIPDDPENADGLNFLSHTGIAEVNKKAFEGTALAHCDGGVPNMTICIDDLTEHSLGALLYFYERACAVSGYMLGVNPFNQPGVEAYKKNMFALMNKPGFEAEHAEVAARVANARVDEDIAFG